uniref:Copine C-terminal domain-containing protein n=1 Tax=Oryza barthii TaxID=65489 RepID=A0A0D3GW28_9ORYZ
MPAKAKGGEREGESGAHSLPFQVSPRRGKGKANPPTKATAAPHPQNPRRRPGGTPPAITGGHSTPLPRAASRRGLTGSPCLAPRPPQYWKQEMHYNAMTLLSDSPYGGFGARPIDVLFPISTGGAMTDLQETIDTIIKASDFPSSILVAGVGGADGNGDNGTGKTSALTARVTGIVRDWTVVLLSALIVADTQLTFINIIGYLIAIAGVVAYNNHKLKVKTHGNEQQGADSKVNRGSPQDVETSSIVNTVLF